MAKDFAKMLESGPRKIALTRGLTGIAAVALVLIKIIIFIVNKNMDMVFMYGNFTQELLETVLNILISLSVVGFISTFFNHRMVSVILIAAGIIAAALFGFRYAFYYGAPKTFTYQSKDQVTTLVIKEEVTKNSMGKLTFYKRISSMWVEEISSVETTGGYRPLSDAYDKCKPSWSKNNSSVTFSYPADEKGTMKRFTINFQ